MTWKILLVTLLRTGGWWCDVSGGGSVALRPYPVLETVITIRNYRDSDSVSVGRLIAQTYQAFNLGFATPDEQAELLGPFHFAESMEPAHQTAIAEAIAAPLVLVAENEGAIVAVLRGGRVDQRQRAVLQSLFVDGAHHHRGIGRGLVGRFEQTCRARGTTRIKLASTLYAVRFYQALGYKRSTGARTMHSFGSSGLPYQPMIKSLT